MTRHASIAHDDSNRRTAHARSLLLGVSLCLSFTASSAPAGAQVLSVAARRNQMVDRYVAGAGVSNPRVLEVMRTVPRHEFVPAGDRDKAYYDMAIPIGEGQTISPPFIVAFMTEKLDPQPADKVLEIGTGSGYQAAVLSGLVKEVYSIEIVEPLGRRAAATLDRLGYDNVFTKIGDGYQGWEEHAPFDSIIVTCSPEQIPQPLIDQLRDGGRMVVPLGERFQQTLYLFRKVDGKMEPEALEGTMFVPMTGQAEQLRQVLPDPTSPSVVNGGFELAERGPEWPDGWYYVRQAQVEPHATAPDGQHVFTMRNTTPGRTAQALQAIGVDGRVIRTLRVSLWARGADIRPLALAEGQPKFQIFFYDERRSPVGTRMLGGWRGTFDWREQTAELPVPRSARLAILGVGLWGSTGELSVDGLSVEAAKVEPQPTTTAPADESQP